MHAQPRRARPFLLILALLAVLGLVAAACGGDDDDAADEPAAAAGNDDTADDTDDAAADDTTDDAAADEAGTADGDLQALIDAATEEGQVNLIALPDTWANYAGILAAWSDKYDIANPVANPDASSADEITAIKTLAGQDDMPDAVDVGPSFTTQLIDEGLSVPYQPSTWDEIPDSLKDPDGNWVAAYYGVMAIGTNTTVIEDAPQTWADLADPAYANSVALNGDPRESGAAFAAVMAASVANGGSFDDIMPGIEFFADLRASGNLLALDVNEANLLSGETPIVLDWSYNFPGIIPKLSEAGVDLSFTVPADGVYGSYYAQAAVADSPHPNAAKLWLEHILSDEGALGYLEGGAVPARYAALVEAGKVSDEAAANLPSADIIDAIEFPTQAQIDAANAALVEHWGPMVADA